MAEHEGTRSRPAWLGSREGFSDEVLPPWTPLRVCDTATRRRGDTATAQPAAHPFTPSPVHPLSIECWGRRYELAHGPFPSAVESAGEPLLAAPIRVAARVGGREVEWRCEALRVVEETPARVVLSAGLSGEDLALEATCTLEYDGMLRVDWRLLPRRPVTLDALCFEMRLPAERARYLYHFPGRWGQTYNDAGWGNAYNARALPAEGVSACFRPFLWLGDDDRGLSWFCETDENWLVADPNHTVNITREGDTVLLRLTLIDTPVLLTPVGSTEDAPQSAIRNSQFAIRNSLNYTFGLQATPVRENPEDVWDWRLCHGGDYGIERLDPEAPATLRYPAEGNFQLQQGTVELFVQPLFDTARPAKEERLFTLQLPKGDEIRWSWPRGEPGMRLLVRQGQDRILDLATRPTFAPGRWHHVAFTWGDAIRVYHDGQLLAEAPRAGTFVEARRVGRGLAGGALIFGGPGGHLLVDEIRVSDVARSAEELAQAAASTTPPEADAHTLLLDHLDEAFAPGAIEHLDGGHGGYSCTNPARAAGDWGWSKKPGGIVGLGRFCEGRFGNALELGLDRPPLYIMADAGVRTLCIHEQWTDYEGYFDTTHGEELRSLVQACHARGIKLLVYLGFLFPDLAPEWSEWGDECVVEPRQAYDPYDYPPQPHQKAYFVCYNSPWQDALAHGIARLIDEYDVDGVYLDGTASTWACSNARHGCGYERPDGTRAGTYPIFAVRDMMRRIYTVVKTRKPDGHVNVHQSTCMTIPTLAWATSTWDGEQYGSVEPGQFALETISLDSFRVEFMGHQWGVPAEFLCYDRPYTYREACAFTLPHDVLVRASGIGPHLELASKLWQVADAFGRKDAEWLPYWRSGEYVSAGPEGVLASLYRHPRNGVLMVVSNLGRAPADAELRLNRERLGLRRVIEAHDALTGEALPTVEGRLAFPLGSLEWRLLWIQGDEMT